MGRNIHVFQFFAVLILMLGANMVFAQSSLTVTLGTETKSYGVDLDEPSGGTPGSTYEWTVVAGTPGSTLPTVPPTDQHNIILDDNKITFDWSASPIGAYTIKVKETNLTCSAEEQTIIVNVVAPDEASGLPSWTNTNICKGGDVTFNVTGALAGYRLNYTLTNATSDATFVTVDGDGNAEITATHDGFNNNRVVLTLVSLELNGATIPYPAGRTATANIIIVETSPIQEL